MDLLKNPSLDSFIDTAKHLLEQGIALANTHPLWLLGGGVGLFSLWVLLGSSQALLRGKEGEWQVRKLLSKLSRRNYRILHDLTLPTPRGTTQIDHLVISRYGLFVIETKNLQGGISGNENDTHWTQHAGPQAYRFFNPLQQNQGHIRAVLRLLELPSRHVHSVVTFVGKSRFANTMPRQVTTAETLLPHLKGFRKEVFGRRDINRLQKRLEELRLPPGRATDRKHIKHVKAVRKQQENRKKPQPTKKIPHNAKRCPLCASPMVLRTARQGRNAGKQFWGCSRYPSCRGILDKK